jgi:hypothetical protein
LRSGYNGKSIYDMIAIYNEYVQNSNGKIFKTSQRTDGDGGYSLPKNENIIKYYQTFNLTQFDATDIIKIHLPTNKGEEIVIELERM